MAQSSPFKMSYGKKSMAGVQSGAAPKVMKGAREAGEKYKAPKMGMNSIGTKAVSKSSGNVSMKPQSASDKTRYTQAKQPVQYSNAGTPRATKFVC